MPRVLRIINRFNLGGPTYNAALLTRYMPEQYETLLIGGAKEESENDSLHITSALDLNPIIIPDMSREINFKDDRRAYQKIKQLIKWFEPDIVHTHASKAGALGRLAAYHSGVDNVVHTFHGHVFHSYFNPLKTKAYIRIEKYLAKRSDAIVAISELQKDELVNTFAIAEAEKVHTIPLGFNLDPFKENVDEKRRSFRTKYKVLEDEIAIGIIGRLVPIKNHRMFISMAQSNLTNRK